MNSVKKLPQLYLQNSTTTFLPKFRLKDHNKLSIPTSYGLEIIDMTTIHFCKSSGNYCEINLLNGKKILFSKTLKSIEKKLNHLFLRVHNSYVVNLLEVAKIDVSNNQLTTNNDYVIPISRSRKSIVLLSLQ